MKLSPQQLNRHLNKGPLQPVYLIHGDETLLVQECADQIRSAASKAGFSERLVMHADRQFQWEELIQTTQSLSLFGDRQLVELRLSSTTLDPQARKALTAALTPPSPDHVILMTAPRLDFKKTIGTKWFETLFASAAVIQIWPIKPDEWLPWIEQRMKAAKLQPTMAAVQALADRVEGNLLAAMQEIRKLAATSIHPNVDVRDIEASVADHARYSVFELVDTAVTGDGAHALRMLHTLRAGGTEPLAILWAMTRELRVLIDASHSIRNGGSLKQVLKQHRLPASRHAIIDSARQRHPVVVFQRCLLEATLIDQAVKGVLKADPWVGFENILLWLGGIRRPGQLSISS